MSDSIRKRFCVRCSGRVKDDDYGAVELQRGEGVICGDDVDNMISSIFVKRDDEPAPDDHRRGARMPVFRERELEGTKL